MQVVKLFIRIKIGEVISFGDFILASFSEDLTAFTDYSPKYTSAYYTQLLLDRKEIELLVFLVQLNGELKVITARKRFWF